MSSSRTTFCGLHVNRFLSMESAKLFPEITSRFNFTKKVKPIEKLWMMVSLLVARVCGMTKAKLDLVENSNSARKINSI